MILMITRRKFSSLFPALLASRAFSSTRQDDPITRSIPSSMEKIPVIGMGTSRTFNIQNDSGMLGLVEVLNAFVRGGGQVIDSSPMYGNAESTVGRILNITKPPEKLFFATKVWIEGKQAGIEQMHLSAKRMGSSTLDLIAVHNLLDWKTQLSTLKRGKEEGKVRYIGITTSHGRYHEELLRIMRVEEIDFVQFSYNIQDRQAERDMLPLAMDQGIATMINRPYARGSLFKATRGHPIPEFARELGINSWAQFFLKFILSHPGVTNIIPATSKKIHMMDNMEANKGVIPTPNQRLAMLEAFKQVTG